jgi:ABC-type multidrug transport system fused ATPase/permease subunit
VALVPRVNAPLAVLVGALALLGPALALAFTLATGALVGAAPAAVAGGFDSPAGHRVLLALAAAGAVFVAQRVLGPLRGTLATVLGDQLDRHLEARLLRAVTQPPGVAHLEDPTVLDKLTLAQGLGAVHYRPGGALAGLVTIGPNWIQSAAYALVLANFRWWLALLVLALNVYGAGVARREFLRTTRVAMGQTRALRRSDYYRDLALTPPAAKEVRIFGLVDWLVDRFYDEWARTMGAVWRERSTGDRGVVLTTLLIGLAEVAALAYLGWRAVAGEIGLASLTVFAVAIRAIGVIGERGPVDFTIEFGTAAVPPLLELERLATADSLGASGPSGAGATGAGATGAVGAPPPPTLVEGLRLEHVTFRYPGGERDTLAGLDLFIPAGRSLAIVGANGAGKTTLIKLLCRLYDPTAGAITVDGVDLRVLDPAAWQRRVAAIFQDFVQYPLPARDNVALGAVERQGDLAGMRTAAQKAGALEVIETLPAGWDTILSRQFTGGAEPSGGQWQRIALARALFAAAAGAAVLILDEPTANLDVRAEAALYERFLEITTGLTTILISHRFSTVRRADRIVVLEDGHVLEEGPHDALMALGGRYAELFTLQASRFVDDGEDGDDGAGQTGR